VHTRAALRATARLLIGALLFAHGALAIAACDWLARAPAEAVAGAIPDCHQAAVSNANLCLAHCLGEDQSTTAPQVPLAALVQAVFVVPEVPVLLPATFARSALRATGPPPRIRFQTLRL